MSETPGAPKTLHQKLLEVQKAVGYFQKENKNSQQGFNYVSSSQVTGRIRESMDVEGLLLKSEIVNHETALGGVATKSGGSMHWVGLEMKFTWIDADNPTEREECLWYAEGLDNSEKASGKAATYGEKYFLLKFFHVPTDQDDPDAWEAKHEPAPEPTPDRDPAGRPQNMSTCHAMLLPKFGGDNDNLSAAVRVAAHALFGGKGDAWKEYSGVKVAELYDRVVADMQETGSIEPGSEDDPFDIDEEA